MTDPHSTNQNLFDAVESNEMQPAVELNIEPATVIDLDAPVVFFQTVEDQHQKWQRANPREPNYAEQIKGAYHLSIYELSGDPVK
jgi:hypothetical protein